MTHIIKHTGSLRLIGNDIDKPAASDPGRVILARVRNSAWPIGVTIALNTVRQNTDSNVIHLLAAQITIVESAIECNQELCTKVGDGMKG